MKTQTSPIENEQQNEAETSWNWGNEKITKQILVVDDEARIREVYQSIFRILGFDVFTAANATDACVVLAAEEIDIVILDINLGQPVRPVLIPVIHHFNKKAKVIISSMYPIYEQKKIFENADGYFDKSDSNDVLIRMVCSIEASKGANNENTY